MASPVDPLFVMGIRLDTAGKKANRGILAAFKKIDPIDLAAAAAASASDSEMPEGEFEEAPGFWDRIVDALIDQFLDAQLDAIDAAMEYLTNRITSKVTVDTAPFLGQAGTQTVESFVGSTPTVVGQKIAAGMDPEQALGESRDLLASSAQSDAYATGRDVVATVANNDPRFTHYARKAEPGACSWCQMLETRGAVYTVDTATKTRDGQPYHKPYLIIRKDGTSALVGGYCQCDMVAEAAPEHANTAETRPGGPGDKAAVRSAYKTGAKTPERAATVRRQLEVLRSQKAAGKATDWTTAKIATLEAEQVGLLGALMSGGFRSDYLRYLRHLPGQHDQKSHGGGGSGGDGRNDYEGSHNAPGRDYGAPMHDPDMMMPDVVTRPELYRTYQSDAVDAESIAAIRKAAKGGPTTKIKVYRAVPDDVAGATINPGDWVTPSKSYAAVHGDSVLNGAYTILEADALAGDLFTEGNSIAEWGWDPEKRPTRSAPLLALTVVTRHMAGKHDQKTHGRKGGGDLPDGWSFTENADRRVIAQNSARGLAVAARESDFVGPNHGDMSSAPARTRAAVAKVAGVIADLDSVNPAPHGVDVTIVRPGELVHASAGGQVVWGAKLDQQAKMKINVNLFATAEGANSTWERSFDRNDNVGVSGDIVLSIVTHEYGHVVQRGAAEDAVMGWRSPAQAVATHSGDMFRMSMNSLPGGGGRSAFDGLSEYAKSSHVEAYAELFTEWALRERRIHPPSALAREMAEREGWK